ncbi:hypothetical protein B6U79_02310 [Candidatus Bathyarchaeota archaeon ex4484_231]|nr:MAG: hypothetical protein B6U79_02310 [Candidatus Bathyarchaeota archaeon ex4484_231]
MMEKDLGYRKVQFTGRGSYIISLPKEWAKEVGIERGSEIAFKVQENSTLLLIPRKIVEEEKEAHKPQLKEYWIHIQPEDSAESVCRKIISLYVVNAGIIHVRFKNRESVAKFRNAINGLVKETLLGAEIIDETSNEVTIQVLVDHPEFPVEKAVRRMAILALSANQAAVSALGDGNLDKIREVAESKNDVGRLNLYVIRQLKFGLERNLFKELGFRTPKEFLGYRIVANDIKSIANNAMVIARNVKTFGKMVEDQTLFLKEAIDEAAYSQILDFNSQAQQLFDESLKAMFKRDYEHADKIISEAKSLADRENDLVTVISSKKLDPNVSAIFSSILDNSRRILEYSRDIAEVTLNRTIEEVSTNRLQTESRR